MNILLIPAIWQPSTYIPCACRVPIIHVFDSTDCLCRGSVSGPPLTRRPSLSSLDDVKRSNSNESVHKSGTAKQYMSVSDPITRAVCTGYCGTGSRARFLCSFARIFPQEKTKGARISSMISGPLVFVFICFRAIFIVFNVIIYRCCIVHQNLKLSIKEFQVLLIHYK